MSKQYDDASDKENKEKKLSDDYRERGRRSSYSSRSSNGSSRSSSGSSRSSSGSSSSGSSSRSGSGSSSSSSGSSSSRRSQPPKPQSKLKARSRSISKSPDERQRIDDGRRRKPLSRSETGRSVGRNEAGFDDHARSPSPKRRRKRTPSPKPPRVYVNKLSRNIFKDHVYEIFSNYGAIKNIEMPIWKNYNGICNKGFAYVEFESMKSAEKALRMDKGQIDGQEVFCEIVDYTHFPQDYRKRSPPPRNNFYPRGGGGGGGGGWGRRFNMHNRGFHQRRPRSPPRRWSPPRQARRRSRSPVRHRRYSRSSSSNSR